MGFSIPHLLVVLVIVILVFGTKRLKNVGTDLGDAIKNFRTAMKDGSEEAASNEAEKPSGTVIEGELTHKEQDKV
jgi:sec-independent protein translocase protein TatA